MKQNTYTCMQAHTYVIISYYIRHTHRVRVGLISKKRERKKEKRM